MIDTIEKTVTHIKIKPYKPTFYGVDKLIADLKDDGYDVYKDYSIRKSEVNIIISPPVNHHIDIIETEKGIKWIGTKNLK